MRAIALSLAVALLASPAQAFSLVEKILEWDASTPLPVCDAKTVVRTITKRFNRAEKSNWKRGFTIDQIGQISERRQDLRSDEFGDPPLVPARYCNATAHMSNGQTYSMHYFIEAKAGFVGVKWGAEFCVHGLDPWRVYNGRCEIAH